MSLLQKVEHWLASTRHVKVSSPWLEACVTWIQQENQGTNLTQAEINKQVFEQWLLTDLRDLECPVLPEGVSGALKCELNGIYCLQIDSLVDVSQPAYSQLQKLRGRDNPNEKITATTQASQKPWEAKPTRMLMLQLTDGVQELQGMEYQPVPCLHTELSPGTKVILYGNITCRLGVLLLTSENVKVLGGEVEALVEEYGQEKVLARLIGDSEDVTAVRPNNQNGNMENETDDLGQVFGPSDEELLASLEDDGFRINSLADSGYLTRNSTITADTASLRSRLDRSQAYGSLLDAPEEEVVEVDHPASRGNDAEFEDFPIDDIEDEMFLEQEIDECFVNPKENDNANQENVEQAAYSKCCNEEDMLPTPVSKTNQISCENVSQANIAGILQHRNAKPSGVQCNDNGNMLTVVSKPQVAACISQRSLENTNRDSSAGSTSCSSDIARIRPVVKCQPFENRLITIGSSRNERAQKSDCHSSASLTALGVKESNKPIAKTVFDTDYSFTYLSVVLSSPESPRVVKVKAFIVTLLSNLANSSGMWRIQAKISDGSAYLDVELADEILASLIGFSASEVNLKRTPDLRKELVTGLQSCQRELIDMCCVMTIRFNHTKSKAVILALHDMSLENLKYLENKHAV
ncbi:recQ-mediated genome instability protein 1 [Protopterus annectens]|uniref:recQ-mediated genome instability protein 1 n=1 Tax=Protopterus annectens TaxID=7888 RepID=UPI001CFAC51C|nr:recQ-mediated genome instability protein 1 [Protopterus annectens]